MAKDECACGHHSTSHAPDYAGGRCGLPGCECARFISIPAALAAARREGAEAMRGAMVRLCRERADTHAKTSDGFAARCMTDAAREYGAKAVALRDAAGALNALPLPGEPPAKESK